MDTDQSSDLLTNVKYSIEKEMQYVLTQAFMDNNPAKNQKIVLYNILRLIYETIIRIQDSGSIAEFERRFKHLFDSPEAETLLELGSIKRNMDPLSVYSMYRINRTDSTGYIHPVYTTDSKSTANEYFDFLVQSKNELDVSGWFELAEYVYVSRDMAQAYRGSGVKYKVLKAEKGI